MSPDTNSMKETLNKFAIKDIHKKTLGDKYLTSMQPRTRSHTEMVGDMSRVILNFDLSKIPLVHF